MPVPVPHPLPSAPRRDWLALGPASRLLGVDPDTLRRWADEGRVEAFATPGGHRRFARQSLERLVVRRRTGPPGALAGLGGTPDRWSAVYRRRYAARSGGEPDPRASVPAGDHASYREHGRRLVEALVEHLDAATPKARNRAEARAVAQTEELGRRLADAGVRLDEAVALFVTARRPFFAELGTFARRRELDAARLTGLYDAATAILDRLLLRLMASHAAAAPSPPGAAALVPEPR